MKYRTDLCINIQEDQEQLILGTLFGDGSCVLQRGAANPYIRINHSIHDSAYTKWKYGILLSSGLVQAAIDKYGSFNTIAHPVLWKYYNLFYRARRKVAPIGTLNLIKPFGLAVWFMDDGSIVRQRSRSKGPYYILATDAFSIEECEVIAQWLKEKYNVEFRVYIKRHKGYERLYPELWTTKVAEGKRFMELVEPYIPDCMCRKRFGG